MKTEVRQAPGSEGVVQHVVETQDVPTDRLVMARGRWITNWRPEDEQFWEGPGRRTARVNLIWSVFCEFLGFAVWQLWSVTVVFLPAAGFDLTTSQQFWLVSLPPLVGATMRIPYSFTVAMFGGRNWTVVSALLLLIPTAAMAIALATPETPVWVLFVVAATAGFGGGNFASSMANITFFYPAKEKGAALGINAAGGNLGVAVAQFIVPVAVTILAFGQYGPALPVAGLIWIPLILLAAWGARKHMHNLSHAKNDVKGSLSALKEKHLWIIAVIYVGTFGSFMGFGSVFPTLVSIQFPEFSSFQVLGAALSLAFMGPLVGSLARPYGGKLADRVGGARVTALCFIAMAAVTVVLVVTLSLSSFWLYLVLFLVLFTLTGFANGASYRMIPLVFRLSVDANDRIGHERKASAALGFIGAIGGFGGFAIPQVLSASQNITGSFDTAFWCFAAAYLGFAFFTWAVYLRSGTVYARNRV
ncbi:MFS transporter [Citricoccus muralis]|uniref:MFS transporter n=1 Tax=Citricoccus muralis TaxID=169134 RepID=A0ABY8H4U2_9MICC|nr:MFS transporter [Citricoccus muralis]WFP16160.1 MFS transporter [Citricoccus muralis]